MNDDLKAFAALEALNFVEDKMVIGLGTGSTTECFIKLLVEKAELLSDIKVVASSEKTALLAKKGNLKLCNFNEVERVDITFDGADEIDEQKRMIKGGGGALLREKILAFFSKKLIIMVDGSKYVKSFKKGPIPIEVLPYGYVFVQKEIEKKGFKSKLRLIEKNKPFVTDNNNYVLDVFLDAFISDPKHIHDRLISIPGVLETGLFFDFDLTCIIAKTLDDIKVI